MLVTLVDNLIKSRTELQNIIKEKSNALEDEKIKNDKISELEAKNVQEIKHYEDLEAEIKRIAKAHKDEVAKLKEELANANENFEVEKAKRENFSDKKDQLQKIVDQLQNLREDCFSIGAQCCQRLSDNFVSIGASSSEKGYMEGDADGTVIWIDGKVQAFGEILSTREGYYAWIGARSVASMLEKVSCKHVKAVGQLISRFPWTMFKSPQ
jgi:hypothetical protein